MRNGPFTDLVADTFGLDPKAVSFAARVVREAGYLTTGARGVNAPHMTPRDAARLSLALMTGETPMNIVREFEHYRALTLDRDVSDTFDGLFSICDLRDGHTLEDMVTWLFGLWAEPAQLAPFAFEIGGATYEPVFFVRLNESTRNVTINLANGDDTVELVYADMSGIQLQRHLHSLSTEALDRGDFALAKKLMGEEHALFRRVMNARGMRVTREISTPEFAAIGRAIVAGED